VGILAHVRRHGDNGRGVHGRRYRQVYLWRLIGMDFMIVRTQYVSFWMFWVFFFGLTVFLPGVVIYVWDFFGLSARPSLLAKPASVGVGK
jgi:hypothetical protein